MVPSTSITLSHSHLPGLQLLHRGKVRDVYALDEERLLMVATDRLSAFDVVLPDPIPGKGEILTELSNFWFRTLADRVPNHVLDTDPSGVLPGGIDPRRYLKRSTVVRRLKPLPVEAIARGWIAGSGWKDYQQSGGICGIPLPPGLRLGDRLPAAIFTPSSKAASGQHDENIDFDAMVARIGGALAEQVRETTLTLYRAAAEHAAARGLIIADTKFEFGLDPDGRLVWMDEALTPDSSRFWPASGWEPGQSPPSFDKQYVRDYLETMDWDKQAPGPGLPTRVVLGTRARYLEALAQLTAA
ncbi:MAG: phosphoribosylaminoimidazolesuccinocarboxamide synthase [Xanthomonadales bacterium]|jgi:phosphoribosylaminoimidazole-succinocarboxamide synthase|nr:phosphoribosylaminoimidazolesuccinocarboxamide synthase [Xanthomonadales bacterium]